MSDIKIGMAESALDWANSIRQAAHGFPDTWMNVTMDIRYQSGRMGFSVDELRVSVKQEQPKVRMYMIGHWWTKQDNPEQVGGGLDCLVLGKNEQEAVALVQAKHGEVLAAKQSLFVKKAPIIIPVADCIMFDWANDIIKDGIVRAEFFDHEKKPPEAATKL